MESETVMCLNNLKHGETEMSTIQKLPQKGYQTHTLTKFPFTRCQVKQKLKGKAATRWVKSVKIMSQKFVSKFSKTQSALASVDTQVARYTPSLTQETERG